MEAERIKDYKFDSNTNFDNMDIENIEIWDKDYRLKKGDVIGITDEYNNLKLKCRVRNIIKKDFTNDRIELEIMK